MVIENFEDGLLVLASNVIDGEEIWSVRFSSMALLPVNGEPEARALYDFLATGFADIPHARLVGSVVRANSPRPRIIRKDAVDLDGVVR